MKQGLCMVGWVHHGPVSNRQTGTEAVGERLRLVGDPGKHRDAVVGTGTCVMISSEKG